jgi:hypothetical protein
VLGGIAPNPRSTAVPRVRTGDAAHCAAADDGSAEAASPTQTRAIVDARPTADLMTVRVGSACAARQDAGG